MSLFRKRKDAEPAEPNAQKEAGVAPESGATAVPAKPKREVHAFRHVPPYEMDEELARRIAMRAYGDDDHDGEPDIPAAQFPG